MNSIQIITCFCMLFFAANGGSAENPNEVTLELNGPAEFVYCDAPQSAEEVELCAACPSQNSKKKDCQIGFFRLEGSDQCFKIFNEETLTWNEAKASCTKKGLHLAAPSDAVAVRLRTYLQDNFEYMQSSPQIWVDAAVEEGTKIVWQRTNTEFTRQNALWRPEWPGEWLKAGSCLRLNAWEHSTSHLPYGLEPCSTSRGYMLCEAVEF